MTDHDLRDLLHDQVADVTTTPDLSSRAWSAARGVRRRRVISVVGGAAVAAVLVVGGVAVLSDRSHESRTPAPAPSPSPSLSPPPSPSPSPSDVVTTPDGRFQGAPVYWSPSLAEEAELPLMTEGRRPLPDEIDLSTEAVPVESAPIDRATAAFGIIDGAESVRLLLLAPDGSYRSLDLSDVGPDPTISCCRRPAVGGAMLSPTGQYVMFPQIDSVKVYDLGKREWRTVQTGSVEPYNATWIGERELYLPRFTGGPGPLFDVVTGEKTGAARFDQGATTLDVGESYRFGRSRTGPDGTIQSWGSGATFPVPEGTPGNPEFLIAFDGRTTILTFTGSPGGDDRWLQCCPVAGWAENKVALYESRSSTPRIIAWKVGTNRFETVATITGFTPGEQTWVGSYARYWE